MPTKSEKWMIWNASPHHYCHDKSLFSQLEMESSPPDASKDFVVLGQGDIVLTIKNHPKLTSIRLKDVFYYETDKPRNIINLKLLQQDYPKLVLGKMKIGTYGTAIVHLEYPEKVVLEVDEYDEER